MRPEIIIKGALEYEGDETTWREYEVRPAWYTLHQDTAQEVEVSAVSAPLDVPLIVT